MAQPLTGVIDLDFGNSAPLARQLYEQLRSAIADGRLQHGYRLPSSRMLAGQLDVSRNTVSAAIDQLAAEGYLDIARGRRPSIAAGLVRLPAFRWGCEWSTCRAGASAALGLGTAHRPIEVASPIRKCPSPVPAGIGRWAAFPHDIWARCLRRAARSARPRRTQRIQPSGIAGGSGPTPRRAPRRQDGAAPGHRDTLGPGGHRADRPRDPGRRRHGVAGKPRLRRSPNGPRSRWRSCRRRPARPQRARAGRPQGQAAAHLGDALPSISHRQADADRPAARAAALLEVHGRCLDRGRLRQRVPLRRKAGRVPAGPRRRGQSSTSALSPR